MDMKFKALYLAAAVAASAALTACDDDFARPPMIMPEAPNIETTSTIPVVKTTFWGGMSTPMQIGTDENGDSVIIRGRICSSDETGNVYKNLIVQTEDEEGNQWALTFAVNKTKMYETYKFGQEIYINVTGMYVGEYRGLMQFGGLNNGQMGFMDEAIFTSHAITSGLPRLAEVDTTATTIAELLAAKASSESLMQWQSRLVRVENVQFEEPGAPYATDQNTNRYVKDAEGNRLIVRNSAYATFKNERLPGGTGNVTGILSYFGSDWQILLIDEEGVQGFDGVVDPEQPSGPTEAVASLSENFDAETKIPTGWTALKVLGDKDWYVREFSGQNYATMTGYKGTAPFDAWLISPAVDLDKSPAKVLSFRSQVNGYGSTTSKIQVYALTGADPTKATLTELTATWPTAPASGYSEWVNSGTVSLEALSGIVYIGFRYTATQDANYATWCVDNVVIGTNE